LISKLGGKIMFEKIQEMMVESLSLEKDDIKLESTFESLEIDSLDVFELVTEIEEEFDIEIEDAENLKSVQDLVAYIEGKVAVK
ncbi:MAG: acyl carrier protein, partial [Intestinibacter sp.]